MKIIHVVCCLLFLSNAGEVFAQWYSQSESHMGTSITIEIWQSDEKRFDALAKESFAEFARIEKIMSPYLLESELSRLNQNAFKAAVGPGEELFSLIELSLSFSEQTKGAFDISFASLGHRFDYRARKKPNKLQIDALKPLIDYRLIQLDSRGKTVQFLRSGVVLDLGGIAKGYAVDRVVELLLMQGIKYAFVSAGGDSRIIGDRKGRPWMVGIKNPRSDEVMITLPLDNVAISTSGDYERYFEDGGVRYHHIINPKSGRSAEGLRSVTIIGEDATTTDALSTSVFVMGVKEGLKLLESLPGVSGVLIDSENKVFYTTDLVEP